jgi:hypothetical protein
MAQHDEITKLKNQKHKNIRHMWVGVAMSTDMQDTTNCRVQNNKHTRQQCAGTKHIRKEETS